MFKFLAALALFAVVASAGPLSGHAAKRLPTSGDVVTTRILGGEETVIEAVPYQVSVQVNGRHFCGGSIISEYYVLTAAHCVHDDDNGLFSSYTIRAGSADSTEGGSVHHVVDFITQKSYNEIFHDNDIALGRVYEPFKFDKTRQPVPLYARDEMTRVGATAVVSGWGSGPKVNKHILNVLEVSIIANERCQGALEPRPFFAGQICAIHNDHGKKFCDGDSGSPLAIKGHLAGIVSLGSDCKPNGSLGIYTEVAYYRDWIKKHSGV